MPASPDGPRCTKIKANGQRCKNPPIHGGMVCNAAGHGGTLPVVKAAAHRRLVEAEAKAKASKALATAGGDPDDLDPVLALLGIAQEVLAFKHQVNGMLAEVNATDWRRDHRAGEQIHSLVTLMERSLDRSAKVLIEINRLGLENRRVRIAEREITAVGNALLSALDRAGIGGSQRSAVIGYLQDELHAAQAAEDSRPALVHNPAERVRTRR
jgi:hypothetical protein